MRDDKHLWVIMGETKIPMPPQVIIDRKESDIRTVVGNDIVKLTWDPKTNDLLGILVNDQFIYQRK